MKNLLNKVCIVLGTRPEIIKLSSVIRECEKQKIKHFIIHSNQHYSKEMDEVFFDDLKLKKPKYNLDVRSGSHAVMTAKILKRIERILANEKPSVLIVQGDTNTGMAGVLVASKMGIKVAHIEAGLRSFDRSMPEEINRIIIDHISDYLFPPTKDAKNLLINEGIDKNKINVVGNTVVDAVEQNLIIANKNSTILKKLNLIKNQYLLLTLHRPSNVDSKINLHKILLAISNVSIKFSYPVVFPIHPRTKKQLNKFKITIPKEIITIKPVGFLDFLILEANANLILTDSGGLQEEACILRVSCVTLRSNTERPETVEVGANILSSNNPDKIIQGAKEMIYKKRVWKNPFGDGKTAQKIIKILNSFN